MFLYWFTSILGYIRLHPVPTLQYKISLTQLTTSFQQPIRTPTRLHTYHPLDKKQHWLQPLSATIGLPTTKRSLYFWLHRYRFHLTRGFSLRKLQSPTFILDLLQITSSIHKLVILNREGYNRKCRFLTQRPSSSFFKWNASTYLQDIL